MPFLRTKTSAWCLLPSRHYRCGSVFALPPELLTTSQGFFDALAVLDVGHDTIPFDDVSISISQRLAAIQMPSILPIRAAKANFAFMRFTACYGRAPFAFMLRKIIGMRYLLATLSPAVSFRRHTRVL